MTSHFNFSLFSFTNISKLSLPISSSPSIINLILHGIPLVFFKTSIALICINIWPLSSQAPLAKIAPSGCISVFLTIGLNGSESHNSIGSTG